MLYKPDERFDALYCVLKDYTGSHQVIIPYKNFIHRKILEFLPFFKRNPDCPDKYITAVFFAILHDFINNRKDDIKFISFEKQSGWYEIVNEKNETIINFAEGNNKNPYIDEYCPQAVKKRKMIKTNRALSDISKEYSECLPNNWKYKFLVVMHLSSILLYFF